MWAGYRSVELGDGSITFFGNNSAARLRSNITDKGNNAILYASFRAYPGMTVTATWDARITDNVDGEDRPYFAVDYPYGGIAYQQDNFQYTGEWKEYTYSFTVPFSAGVVEESADSAFIKETGSDFDNEHILFAFGVYTSNTGELEITRPRFQVTGAPYHFTSRYFENTIVESGSNSDGEWTRWADGTQQCRYYEENRLANALFRTEGSMSFYYAEHEWVFPAAFISPPFVDCNGRPSLVGEGIRIFKPTAVSGVSSTSAGLRLCAPDDFYDVRHYSAFSSGRWK